MRNKALWTTALLFAVPAFVQPTWDWLLSNVLDKAASNPGWVLDHISRAVALIAPFQPYMIGIAAGLFVAAVLTGGGRVFESHTGRKKQELWGLGQAALNKADNISAWLRNPFLYNDHVAYLTEVYVLLLRFQKAGFLYPEVGADTPTEEKLEIARRYFVVIGTLLEGGHELEARHAALEASEKLPGLVRGESHLHR